MNQPRLYTEHSPAVIAVRERLVEEWAVQKAVRSGTPYRKHANTAGNETSFTKAALMCVRRGIDPAKLVEAALRHAEGSTTVQPSFLVSVKTLDFLDVRTAVDETGSEHKILSTREANYRAEWNKVKALLKNGVPALHLMDASYGLKPLVRWVLATKMKFDIAAIYVDAVAEYRRNKGEATTVFGTDVFKGLR